MRENRSKFWFVPRKELYISKGDKEYSGTVLRRADSMVDQYSDQLVEHGHAFTILLKSFYVTQDKDKGDNDIFVRSWTKYGSNPQIEGAHFFKKDVPVPYFCHSDLRASHIFSSESHLEENRVWLKLQILEIDGRNVDQFTRIVENDLRDTLRSFGAVFPGTLPFISTVTESSATSNALALVGKLRKLVSNKNDTLFEQALDFLSINSGETPFRYGVYIFFQKAIEGHCYRLKEFTVKSKSDNHESNIHDHKLPDYVVIEVVPGIVNMFSQDNIIINQNLATGLLPFDEKFSDPGEKDERFHYLQRLMKKAHIVDDIREYYILAKDYYAGQLLDKHQQNRYRELVLSLGEYIDSIQEILGD